MDKKDFEKALQEGKIFQVYGNCNSFFFAAQIPDNSIGCSGSRCSNCGDAVAYCEQLCKNCKLPFVGPTGFPQWYEWQSYTLEIKKGVAWRSFYYTNHGRLGYSNVAYIPLTNDELLKVENLSGQEAALFSITHAIHPEKIREILRS